MMMRDSRGRRVAPRRVHYTFRDTAVASSSSALAGLRVPFLPSPLDSEDAAHCVALSRRW